MAAIQLPDFFAGAFEHALPLQFFLNAFRSLLPTYPVQSSVIVQVLQDAEVKVQRGLLENDTQFGQRLARVGFDVVAGNADLTVPAVVEVRDQRKQGGFARAIRSQ